MFKDLRALGLFGIALLCRIPFLWEGYGKEFDAWSNALNARIISQTGVYEVSRLPGHPLQEMLLSSLWSADQGYFLFNFLSAIFSAFAVWAFYQILKFHQVRDAFTWTLAFNFIPVFFIAGTYTIDYNYALAFILLAYLSLLREKYILAGVFLGLATGFRISSLGFLLPFFLLLGLQWRPLLKLFSVAFIVSAISYALPISTYGWSFLDFHKPPFPGWSSVLYKLSIGIWGLPLLIFMLLSSWILIKRKAEVFKPNHFKGLAWPWFLLIVILLQLLVFLRLPFKAEFFIPALPFILLAWAAHSRGKMGRWAAYASLTSCLFFGFDYKNSWRGAEPIAGHFEFKAGDKEIYCSPFQGPLSIDQSKRRVRSATVEQGIQILQKSEPALVVAGWYLPELLYKYPDGPHEILHYASQDQIDSAHLAGLRILYLPEIGQQNEIMSGHSRLVEEGQPLLRP